MRSLDLERAYQEERRNDMMRRAAKRRLIEEASVPEPEPRPERFYSALLVRVGCWLASLGALLQVRDRAEC
jgi:hypothetical protein